MPDFQNIISQLTSENNGLKFDIFKAVPNQAIQKHAPTKQWYVCANQAPFINKTKITKLWEGQDLEINF